MCNEFTILPEGKTCANQDEVQAFFNEASFALFTLRSFIDYQNVDVEGVPRDHPVQSLFELHETVNLKVEKREKILFQYIEH